MKLLLWLMTFVRKSFKKQAEILKYLTFILHRYFDTPWFWKKHRDERSGWSASPTCCDRMFSVFFYIFEKHRVLKFYTNKCKKRENQLSRRDNARNCMYRTTAAKVWFTQIKRCTWVIAELFSLFRILISNPNCESKNLKFESRILK